MKSFNSIRFFIGKLLHNFRCPVGTLIEHNHKFIEKSRIDSRTFSRYSASFLKRIIAETPGLFFVGSKSLGLYLGFSTASTMFVPGSIFLNSFFQNGTGPLKRLLHTILNCKNGNTKLLDPQDIIGEERLKPRWHNRYNSNPIIEMLGLFHPEILSLPPNPGNPGYFASRSGRRYESQASTSL